MLTDMIAVDATTTTNDSTTTTTAATTTSQLRSQILQLGASVGQLCALFLSPHVPLDPSSYDNGHNASSKSDGVDGGGDGDDDTGYSRSAVLVLDHDNNDSSTVTRSSSSSSSSNADCFWSNPSAPRDDIYLAIGKIFWNLVQISKTANIDLSSSILKKMDLNARKYPVHLCKGKSGKYTKYSSHTGITQHNQSLLDISLESEGNSNEHEHEHDHGHDHDMFCLDSMTVLELTKSIREFALERNWSQYHTPRNIVLAMMGEMGELAEIFQWMGDDCNGSSSTDDQEEPWWKEGAKDKDHFQQELADVSIYCLRLADVVGIEDLGLVASSFSNVV
jgi:NTP pyrophosphatase (non-canonical NTP hydrolase)